MRAPVGSTDTYAAQIAEHRAKHREWLSGPGSYLAAVARHELPVGQRVRLHGFDIEALPDGFRVNGEPSGPRTIDTGGRYRLRLSHQNFPAVVVLDAQSPRLREPIEPRWFPVDPAYGFVLPLEQDGARSDIRTTRDQDRPAERAGWFTFSLGGTPHRVSATRFLEPGGGENEVYFTDLTSGRESYRMRYVPVERDGELWVLDFNRAYNPACAWSPFYNCPIPPPENHLSIAIAAGEMAPSISGLG